MKIPVTILSFIILITLNVSSQSKTELAEMDKYLRELKDTNEIIRYSDSIIYSYPNNPEILFITATNTEHLNSPKELRDLYWRIIKIDSTFSEAYYNVAVSLLNECRCLIRENMFSRNTYWKCNSEDELICVDLAKKVLPLLEKSLFYYKNIHEEDKVYFEREIQDLKNYLNRNK